MTELAGAYMQQQQQQLPGRPGGQVEGIPAERLVARAWSMRAAPTQPGGS